MSKRVGGATRAMVAAMVMMRQGRGAATLSPGGWVVGEDSFATLIGARLVQEDFVEVVARNEVARLTAIELNLRGIDVADAALQQAERRAR